jgi:Guanosine polyphosphate pyrophosphohydrolases/synthetases
VTPKIEKAIELAIKYHKGQKRKGSGDAPYIVHPISVAMIIYRYCQDEDVIIAAILHDILEDTSCSPDMIRNLFGSRVLFLIKGVSDKRPQDPWVTRKAAYLKHLKSASKGACLIACADNIHNLDSLLAAYERSGETIWRRFSASKERKITFYEDVYKAVKVRFKDPIVLQLGNTLKKTKKKLGVK